MRLRSKRARRALTTATTEGWVQPFRLAGGEAARPTVTTIGNLDSPLEATVDARGLVTPGGAWSLDWWVGADDRWHVPSREVAVRQKLLADSPVVESAMRVPSGDVVQRAYAVRLGADELVVVEFENTSPVPVALALALRPYDARGEGRLERVAVEGLTVLVDGEVALLAAKPPARVAGSTGTQGDVAEVVLAGAAAESASPVHDRDGRATFAAIWPLPHKATIQVALPLGPTSLRELPGLPTSTQVANGWRAHADRGARLVLPDDRLAAAVTAARATLLLRHDGPSVGDARALVAAALSDHGFADEAAEVLAGDPAAVGIPALASHWRRFRDVALATSLAPDVAELADRHEADLDDAADLLDAAGEPKAAENARTLANRRRNPGEETGDPSPVRSVDELLGAASPTWTWDEPDLGAAAELLVAVRAQLARESAGGVDLLTSVPDAWLGAGIEVHGAPTAWGPLSFAIRWHGDRPALLWELVLHDGTAPPTLRAPGLDPSWSTTEPKGEALLAQVLPRGTPVTFRRK